MKDPQTEIQSRLVMAFLGDDSEYLAHQLLTLVWLDDECVSSKADM